MHTQTITEAISNIKSPNYRVRFKLLQDIFATYSKKFSKLKSKTMFEDVPVHVEWIDQKKFRIGSVIFAPDTMADFVSVISALGYDLKPRYKENSPNDNLDFVVMWNKDRNKD